MDPSSDASTGAPDSSAAAPEIDPAQLQYLQQQLVSEQNLPLALIGGAVAAAVSAAIWAGVTASTGYQIGFMAIGVGFVVGYAVRILGKGMTSPFGIVGAVFSLLGCAVGNLLAVTQIIAAEDGGSLLDALPQLTPELAQELMVAFFSPMDLLFYALALYYGYTLAFRQLTEDELQTRLSGVTPPA